MEKKVAFSVDCCALICSLVPFATLVRIFCILLLIWRNKKLEKPKGKSFSRVEFQNLPKRHAALQFEYHALFFESFFFTFEKFVLSRILRGGTKFQDLIYC